MMVSRVLNKLKQERGDIEIHEVDILLHPRTAIKEGITMIPTLVMNDKKISGLFLSEKKIREFLQ